jgi:hypothetical protein
MALLVNPRRALFGGAGGHRHQNGALFVIVAFALALSHGAFAEGADSGANWFFGFSTPLYFRLELEDGAGED